jgi:hypothetical protein
LATVTKYAQSNASITTGWTNPTYGYTDDANFATSAPAKNSSVISDYYNFDFQIPVGSTINSVTFEILYKSSTTASTGATITVQPILNATLRGTAKSGAMNTNETVISSALAGTWSLAELNDNTQAGGFKLRLSGKRTSSNTAITWSLDYVKATVDYTVVHSGAVNISGSATIGIVGANTHNARVSASCSAILSPLAQLTYSISLTLNSTVSFAIGGSLLSLGSSSVNGSITISTIGTKLLYGVVLLNGTIDINTVGTNTHNTSISVSAICTTSIVGQAIHIAASSVNGSVTSSAGGLAYKLGMVTGNCVGTISTVDQLTHNSLFSISGVTSVSITGNVTIVSNTSLTNIVTNGNFVNTTEWTPIHGIISAENNILTATASGVI